jgi:thiamine-monophosphate kinase
MALSPADCPPRRRGQPARFGAGLRKSQFDRFRSENPGRFGRLPGGYSWFLPLPEKSLIARIRRQARGSPAVVAGIGDDCAILRPPLGHQLLVTTDFTLEDVHFRREWHPPEVVGRRCLTRGLSDIAAMGGEPLAVFLSLALPKRLPQKWVDRFLHGLLELANEFKVPLAGGDTAQSATGIQADIVVVGSVPKGTAVLRSGARTGDRIYVTGELGGSAAALARLRTGKVKVRPAEYRQHFHPTPRLAVGKWLRSRSLATAMIDLSDGLSTDLAHLCEESGVGAVLEAGLIPRACVGRPLADVSLDLALHGGEDYELLFTSSGKIPATLAGVSVTRIGQVTRTREMALVSQDGRRGRLATQGWEHFRGDSG